jgi:hypothetical protein
LVSNSDEGMNKKGVAVVPATIDIYSVHIESLPPYVKLWQNYYFHSYTSSSGGCSSFFIIFVNRKTTCLR